MGGENLLDKADCQRRLLETAAKELEARARNEQRLRDDLQKKEVMPGVAGVEINV